MTVPHKLTFAIHDLGCTDCVSTIENAVMPLPGVTYVGVSLSRGAMTIRSGLDFDGAAISKVRLLGYGVGDDCAEDVAWLAGCPCRAPSAVGERTQVR